MCQKNNHISSSVKSWRVWGNWVLNEPSWIEKSWVTIGQNECESVHSLHTASAVSIFTLCIHYPQRRITRSWTRTAEQDLRSRSATAELKMHHFTLWMNEWISEGMNERNGANEWTVGEGRLQCYAVSTWSRPSLFVLPSSPPSVWLAERNQCCWKVLQSYGGYPPPSPPQPLQFMNESWKNWMKKWVACERIVCAHSVLCSSENICLVLVIYVHFICILYIYERI